MCFQYGCSFPAVYPLDHALGHAVNTLTVSVSGNPDDQPHGTFAEVCMHQGVGLMKKPTPWDISHIQRHARGFTAYFDGMHWTQTVRWGRAQGEGERVMQCNEGKWDFRLRDCEDAGALVLEVEVGPHIDTSLIRVDVQPVLVRLLIKVRALPCRQARLVNSHRVWNAVRSPSTCLNAACWQHPCLQQALVAAQKCLFKHQRHLQPSCWLGIT